MKLSYSTIFCLCAGILYGVPAPAFSAESVTHHESVVLSATDSLEVTDTEPSLPETSLATATLKTEEDQAEPEAGDGVTEPSETPEETEVAEPAEETAPAVVFDPFAAEPFANTSLLRMKKRLQSLSETCFAHRKTADLALAIIAASSDDRFFRRTGEFSVRISRHLPFPSLAATLIIPEFLGVANELMIRATRTLINSTMEVRNEPLQHSDMLERLAIMSKLTSKIADCQRQIKTNISNLNRQLTKLNSQRFTPVPPGQILKNMNSSMLQLIEKYLSHWSGLINQFDRHYEYFSGQLRYLADSGASLPSVRQAAYLNLMLRSLLDFKVSLEKYYGQLSACPARVSEWQKVVHDEIKACSERNNRFNGRLDDFMGKFPDRDVEDRKAPDFSADAEIQNVFSLLEKMTQMVALTDEKKSTEVSANTEAGPETEKATLLDLLRPYINGAPWIEPEPLLEIEEEIPTGTETCKDSENDLETPAPEGEAESETLPEETSETGQPAEAESVIKSERNTGSVSNPPAKTSDNN